MITQIRKFGFTSDAMYLPGWHPLASVLRYGSYAAVKIIRMQSASASLLACGRLRLLALQMH